MNEIQQDESPTPTRRGPWRLFRRLNSPRGRVTLAACVALIGIGAALWSVTSHKRGNAAVAESIITFEDRLEFFGLTPDSIAPIPEDDFRPLDSPEDVDDAMQEMESLIVGQTGDIEGLRSLPIETQRSFAHAATLSIAPFLTGDLDQLLHNVELLGGVQPATDEEWNSLRFRWKYNNDRMKFAAIAPSHSYALLYQTQNAHVDRFEHMQAMYRIGIEEPGGHRSKTFERFPEVAEWDSRKHPLDAYEARVPVQLLMKMKGDTRLGMLGMVMAQNPTTGQWQPVLIRLFHDDKNNPKFQNVTEVREYMDYMPSNLWMQ